MSKAVQANANLLRANEIRRQGFKSLLDAQPEMRQRFIDLYQEGYGVRAIHRMLLQEYRTDNWTVPSRAACQAFANNHLQQAVIVEPYAPDYAEMLRKFDPLKEMFEVSQEAKQHYLFIIKARVGVRGRVMARKAYMDTLEKLDEYARRNGITSGFRADMASVQQNITNNISSVTVNAVAEPEHKPMTMSDRIEEVRLHIKICGLNGESPIAWETLLEKMIILKEQEDRVMGKYEQVEPEVEVIEGVAVE